MSIVDLVSTLCTLIGEVLPMQEHGLVFMLVASLPFYGGSLG